MGNSCRICNTIQTQLSDPIGISHPVQEEDPGQFLFQSTLGRKLKFASQIDLMKPYCSIGLLTFIKEGQKQGGSMVNATGTLIMGNLVLTAAHTFFRQDGSTQKVIKYIPTSFHFQLHGQFSQDSHYEVEDYRICPMFETYYVLSQDNNYFQIKKNKITIDLIGFDYALIKLKKPVPIITFPKIISNLKQVSKTCNKSLIYGYPEEAMLNNIGAKIMGDKGQIKNITTNILSYNVGTSRGQSGSPVFLSIKDIDEQEHFYLVGVHSGHFQKCFQNYGALVSESMVESIKEWQKEMLQKGEEEDSYNICLLKDQKIIDVETYKPPSNPIIEPKSVIAPQPKSKPQSKSKSKSMIKPQWIVKPQYKSMFDPKPLQLFKPKQPRYLPGRLKQQKKLPAVEIKPIYQVKRVKPSPTLLSKYQPLKFKFDMRTGHSEYYTIGNKDEKTIVKRKLNRNYFQSRPYHLATLKPIINGKWKISLKLLRTQPDDAILKQISKNPLKLLSSSSQITLIGFMNSYRKGSDDMSGFIDQKQCVSICIRDQIIQTKQQNQQNFNGGKQKKRSLQHHASILIDGVIDQQYKDIVFEKECEIIIYINIQDKIILWKLPNQTLECPIPQSIFSSNGQMVFFVGLSNPDKYIEIHQPNDTLRITS